MDHFMRITVSLCLFLSFEVCCLACSDKKVETPRITYFIDCSKDQEVCYKFNRPRNLLEQNGKKIPIDNSNAEIVNVIASSKVMFTGTVLKINLNNLKTDERGGGKPKSDLPPQCNHYDWNVVTQARESSSVLIYGPGDIGSGSCPAENSDKSVLYLVVPVDVKWAEVTGYRYLGGDSFHKTAGPIPATVMQCKNDQPPPQPNAPRPPLAPPQGIDLCDHKPRPQDHDKLPYYGHVDPSGPSGLILNFAYHFGWLYTRLTQPGTGTGTISYSPVVGNSGALNLSYDMQINPTSQLGPGWIGVPFVFEKSSTQKANLDSLTTAISYEVHLPMSGDLLPPVSSRTLAGYNPIAFAIRSPEVQLRSGIEYAPTFPHDLNTLQAESLKIPLVKNFRNQPSSLTLYPIVGLEEVHHEHTHLLGEGNDQTRRFAGADASLRWPFQATHNLLGDKPITVEYSYRNRWLSSAEPTTNYDTSSKATPKEYLSDQRHWYERASFSAPISSYLQFKVTVQHGSLPPDFRTLGYTLQVGLSFSDPGSVEH